MGDVLEGYRGKLRKLLEKSGAKVGDELEIEFDGKIFRGILLPRSRLEDEWHIVLKLSNGYNIGLRYRENMKLRIVERGKARLSMKSEGKIKERKNMPRIMILGVGGTIASRVDYNTGAVRSDYTPEELLEIFPELIEMASIETKIIMNKYSEHLKPSDWAKIAEEAKKAIDGGADGVIIMHGTDTMHYTSAALSFALQNLPVPVILVGSQRSSDRPSSDAALNLISAVRFAAEGPVAEVTIAMHENTSDSSVVFHRGTRVRKNHTSRRDAFQTIQTRPYARVIDGKRIELISKDFRVRNRNRKLVFKGKFNEKAALLKFHPGFNPKLIDFLVEDGYKGIILEGTGLGHVGEYLFDTIKNAISKGVLIFMTSQCIWGRTNLRVYDTGRYLLNMGVIPLENMISETALVKLMWCLGQTKDLEEIKKLMITNIAGEITETTLPKEVAS